MDFCKYIFKMWTAGRKISIHYISTVVPPNSRFIGSTVEKTRELDFLKDILSLKNLELGILLMGIKRNGQKKFFANKEIKKLGNSRIRRDKSIFCEQL